MSKLNKELLTKAIADILAFSQGEEITIKNEKKKGIPRGRKKNKMRLERHVASGPHPFPRHALRAPEDDVFFGNFHQ